MAEKTKTYRKECEYCKTEYTAKSPTSKTCSDNCRKRLSRARKSTVTSSVTVTPVTPENGQPDGSQSEVEAMMQTLIKLSIESTQRQIEVAEMQAQQIETQRQSMEVQKRTLDFLEQVGLGGFLTGQPNGQTATNLSTNFPMPNTPLVLPDKPMNTTHTFEAPDFGDLTAGVVVKKASEPDKPKESSGVANFLGMVAAFNDDKSGMFDPHAKVRRRD